MLFMKIYTVYGNHINTEIIKSHDRRKLATKIVLEFHSQNADTSYASIVLCR